MLTIALQAALWTFIASMIFWTGCICPVKGLRVGFKEAAQISFAFALTAFLVCMTFGDMWANHAAKDLGCQHHSC